MTLTPMEKSARPIAADTIVETHLAWRRKGMSDAMRRFADTSKRVSEHYM